MTFDNPTNSAWDKVRVELGQLAYTLSRNRWQWAVGFILVLALCTSLYAQRGRWTFLGDAHVDGMADQDRIRVGRAAGAYRAIQLRISGGAINFDRVIVRYGNGTQEDIPIRARIPDRRQTRVIDLPVSGVSSRASTSGTARTPGTGAPK